MSKILFLFFICLFVFQNEAYAYINPGTGSDFVQMLIALLLGIVKFFKNIVAKIKQLLGFKSNKKNDEDDK